VIDLPKRLDSERIGDLGEIRTIEQLVKWGWVAEKIESDYGEDVQCNIFIENSRTNLYFRCQVKSFSPNSSYVRKLKNGNFSFSISSDIAKIWVTSYFPIFFVVYDVENDILYWCNLIEELKNKTDKFNQKTLTIRIDQSNVFSKNKKEVEVAVIEYYKSILMVKEPIYDFDIYPIIMPHYGSLPFFSINEITLKHEYININLTSTRLENLPSWFTTINTLDLGSIWGWKFTCEPLELNLLLNQIKNILSKIGIKLKSQEWMAFIISPIIFRDKKYLEWKKEMTDWNSYFLLGNKVNSDYEYGFKISDEFLRPIGRHGGSWAVTSYVNPDVDIALELFSSIGISKAYKMECDTIKKVISSKFEPWDCPIDKINILGDILKQYELSYQIIDEKDDYYIGIIADSFFDPSIRIYSSVKNWDEYIQGIVKYKIGENYAKLLPGKKGKEEIRQKILDYYEEINLLPESILISEDQIISGLPIDHSKRIVSVTRYRSLIEYDQIKAKKILNKCVDKIKCNTNNKNINYEIDLWDGYVNNKILKINISWQPNLSDSSFQSYQKISNIILKYYKNNKTFKR